MKLGSKYLFPPVLALFFFMIGAVLILINDIIVGLFASWLAEVMPVVFGRPSSISDPEGYERYELIITVITIVLTLLPVTFFSMRLDNKRFEHIVVLTEGLYTIPDTARWHFKTFWLSDLFSATVAPLVFTLPVYLIPEKFVSPFQSVLWCGGRLSLYMPPVGAVILMLSLSLSLRILLLPAVLRAWRSSWITGSID